MSANRTFITREEVINHDRKDTGFWVIVDSYVLDLASFLQKHPAGANKIIERRKKSVDLSSNFLDHFGHTVRAFRVACKEYESSSKQNAVVLKFPEVVGGEVLIIGKVQN